ncbi:MAG: hypothetical protein NC311_15010, partial [Muribaculaceae bacterium]|nr:hypothetical protein [Muribaculaceae bacterium]
LFALFVLTVQTANAFEFTTDLPDNLPKEKPMPEKYVPRASTQVFFQKWAQSIRNDNKTVERKISDKKYTGIGLKQWDEELFEYFPQISIENDKEPIECTLYTGMVSAYAYNGFKSPMLYDAQNKICVAIIGKRGYQNSENPYFIEPYSFKNMVYVGAPLNKQISLQELALIPKGATEKEVKKYLNAINKLYKKTTSNEYLQIKKAQEMAKNVMNQYGQNE